MRHKSKDTKKGQVPFGERKDVDTPGQPEQLLPTNIKDPAVFQAVQDMNKFRAFGQTKDSLIAMLVIYEEQRVRLTEKVNVLEKQLEEQRCGREESEKTCSVLQERLGSPSLVMAGLFAFISTVLFAMIQSFELSKRSLVIFGCAVLAGVVPIIFATVSYFTRPRNKP